MAKKKHNTGYGKDYMSMFECKNALQQSYLNGILHNDVTIGVGSAGSGKTYVAAYAAAQAITEFTGNVERIVITKPMVETGGGSKFGALPGDKDEKFFPWLGSIVEPLQDFLTKGAFEYNVRSGAILLQPLAFCRGMSFNRSFVILEEAQNATIEEIKMLCTRIGYDSKLVITGDTNQIDLKKEESGLLWLVDRIREQNASVPVYRFNRHHCIRSEACAKMLDIFEKAEKEGGRKDG